MARVEVITGPERRRRWSEEQKRAAVGFTPVLIASAESPAAPAEDGPTSGAEPAIEVEFAGKTRVRIPGSVPAALAAAVVKALARR